MSMQRVSFVLTLTLVAVMGLYFNKFQNQISMVRVCINSQVSGFQSTCVLCDANRYSQTSLACTGQTSVPANTNQSQALCLINLCSNQVSQTALNIGRKKRHNQYRADYNMKKTVKTFISLDYDSGQ